MCLKQSTQDALILKKLMETASRKTGEELTEKPVLHEAYTGFRF